MLWLAVSNDRDLSFLLLLFLAQESEGSERRNYKAFIIGKRAIEVREEEERDQIHGGKAPSVQKVPRTSYNSQVFSYYSVVWADSFRVS